MLEAIFAMSAIEFVATLIIIIDFGPEVMRKVKAWGRKDPVASMNVLPCTANG